MKDAPFKQIHVPRKTADPDAVAARKQLQGILDQLLAHHARRLRGERIAGPKLE